MRRKTRVLVVDDSAFMRKLITEMINSDRTCQVIKTARDGVEALKAVEELKPDVVTLDIELPEIDGITVLAYIMEDFPTPVVMISGFSNFLGEETIKALEYGAVGFLRKPAGPLLKNMDKIKKELLSQIKIASKVDTKKLTPVISRKRKPKSHGFRSRDKIVVIGSSSGGPRALSQIIPILPDDFPATVLIIQHMPNDFIPSFAKRLNWESNIEVKVAQNSEQILPGKALVIPADCYCQIREDKKGKTIHLIRGSKDEKRNLDSIDKTMERIALLYGKNTIGIILTGMGSDGTKGLTAIKKYDGYTIAEHESTCIVYGMPYSAIKSGVVDKIIPLNKIASEIIKKVRD